MTENNIFLQLTTGNSIESVKYCTNSKVKVLNVRPVGEVQEGQNNQRNLGKRRYHLPRYDNLHCNTNNEVTSDFVGICGRQTVGINEQYGFIITEQNWNNKEQWRK